MWWWSFKVPAQPHWNVGLLICFLLFSQFPEVSEKTVAFSAETHTAVPEFWIWIGKHSICFNIFAWVASLIRLEHMIYTSRLRSAFDTVLHPKFRSSLMTICSRSLHSYQRVMGWANPLYSALKSAFNASCTLPIN